MRPLSFLLVLAACADHGSRSPTADAPVVDSAVDAEPVIPCDFFSLDGAPPSCPVDHPYCCSAPQESILCEPMFFEQCVEQPVTAIETPCNPMNGGGCTGAQNICCRHDLDPLHRTYCSDHVLLGGWTCAP